MSTRRSCLLMEAGCCPSTAGSLERVIPVLTSAIAGAHMVLASRGILDCYFVNEDLQGGNLNGAQRREGPRARSRPSHLAKTDGTPTGTSMLAPLMVNWMLPQSYCSPVLHNSAWGSHHISVTVYTHLAQLCKLQVQGGLQADR